MCLSGCSGRRRVERVASTIVAVFMFAIMMIVFGDVVMRYVFNQPFSWAYDLIFAVSDGRRVLPGAVGGLCHARPC